MSRILFAVLPRPYQIKILDNYYGRAKLNNVNSLTEIVDPDPLSRYDKIYDQYLSLPKKEKRKPSVQGILDDFSADIEESYMKLVYICLLNKRPIPAETDFDAKIMINKVLKDHPHLKPVKDPDPVKLEKPIKTKGKTKPKTHSSSSIHVSSSSSPSSSSLILDTIIKPEIDSSNSIDVPSLHENNAEPSDCVTECENIQTDSATSTSTIATQTDDVDFPCILKSTAVEISTQTDESLISINLNAIIRKMSSKIRRLFYQARICPLPLSCWEIKRICSIIYNMTHLPARAIRLTVKRLLLPKQFEV